MNLRKIIFLTFLFLSVVIGSAAEPSITMTLEPKTMPLNKAVKLTVSISNAERGARLQLPDVENLNFSSMGQNSRTSIVNGKVTSQYSYSFRVTASKEGVFHIPGAVLETDGKKVSSNSEKLTVMSPQKTPVKPKLGDELSDEEKKKLAFVTIERADNKGREHLYVGESTPVLIQAHFRSDFRVSGVNVPSLSSDAFTLSALSDDPEQGYEVIDGVRYRVISWYGNLSGIKAGDYDLTTEIEATINIPIKESSNKRRSNDPFDDPFFSSFFTRYESKELNLKSEMKPTKVITPPLEGRPESFTGAVGQYIIKAKPLPSKLATGEAVTLETYIEGTGNFDRVDKPTLMPSEQWKTYEAETKFERADIVDFHARKHFSIPAIVMNPGEVEAFFQFSYFDPDTEEYKIAETTKYKINVTGESVAMIDPVITNEPKNSNSLVIKSEIGTLFSSSSTLYQKTWFRVFGVIVLLTMLGSVFGILQQGQTRAPKRLSQRVLNRETEKRLSNIEDSIADAEALSFFRECRQLLQIQIAREIESQPEAITVNDILEKFPENQSAKEVFEKADEVEFAPQEESAESLSDWLNKTRVALEGIQNPIVNEKQKSPSSWGQISPTV